MTEKEQTTSGNMIAALVKIILASALLIGVMLAVGVNVTPFHIIGIFGGCAVTLLWSSRQGKDGAK